MIRFDCICILIIFEEQERNDFSHKVWESVKHFLMKYFQSILVLLLNFREGFNFLNVWHGWKHLR